MYWSNEREGFRKSSNKMFSRPDPPWQWLQTLLCNRIISLKHRFLGPTPRFYNSVALRWGPRICIANNFPGDTEPASIHSLWEPLFYRNCSPYSLYNHWEYSLRYLHCKIMPLQLGSEYMLGKMARMTKSWVIAEQKEHLPKSISALGAANNLPTEGCSTKIKQERY